MRKPDWLICAEKTARCKHTWKKKYSTTFKRLCKVCLKCGCLTYEVKAKTN